ncbi:MAG: hypothetical protein ACQERC_05500 [Bacteroidota bacterium]
MKGILEEKFSLETVFDNSWSQHYLKGVISYNGKATTNVSQYNNIAGVYVFWWSGSISELKKLNRKILLKGKKRGDCFLYFPVEWQTDWLTPVKLNERTHYAVYVGKSTSLRSRFVQHLCLKSKHQDWKNETLKRPSKYKDHKHIDEHYNDGYMLSHSPTTSCQFRSGMELLCLNQDMNEEEFWELLKSNITVSFKKMEIDVDEESKFDTSHSQGVIERFYLEDYLIGALRPCFNLESER